MPKQVVIVGGGFAGLAAAKRLRRADVEITLIDRRNHHLFQPLLYQVAMAGLSPADIAEPIRGILSKQQNVCVLQADVTGVNFESQKVLLASPRNQPEEVDYDYLLLACGARHSYFGNSQWEPMAPGLKTLEQATEIRRRVLHAFEQAERESDPQRQKQLLTFIVIGGGPTGVELAGAIGEMRRYTLARDFRKVDASLARVLLIEGGPRILPMFDEGLATRATRDLERLGVHVWTSSRVTNISEHSVQVGEEHVSAETVLWAAGVEASSLGGRLGLETDRCGRIIVQPDLSLAEHPNVFVAGDQAHFEQNKMPLPGIAPVAMQQGRYVAAVIKDRIDSKESPPFRYVDKGQMATIGRSKAITQVGRLKFGGFAAWIAWLVVHVFYLTGFRNRLFVVLSWAWSYLTYRRGARLIVEKEWRQHCEQEDRNTQSRDS